MSTTGKIWRVSLQTIGFRDNFESTDFNKKFRTCLFDPGLVQLSPVPKASAYYTGGT